MKTENACSLTSDVRQCCCRCKYHLADYEHCGTNPLLLYQLEKKFGSVCICGIQKGWVCANPAIGIVHSNWPEHSVGCECYTEVKHDA